MRQGKFRSIRTSMPRIFSDTAPFYPAVLLIMICLTMAACQKIDATGQRQLSFIGEQQEVQMGQSSNEEIVKTMGLYEDEGLQSYVSGIGSKIARTTERPELPWTFQVMDNDVVNAFALPGGYIYLTRGIMAHFENEAQMVGVLSHEIAHVTAKHSVIRLSKAMVTQLGLGVATIAVPELQEFSSILGQGMQLLFLKFSRDDETEADRLGIRYMVNVNEDPGELIDVMEMLGSMTGEGGALPQWASTHPHPENRIDFITARIAESDHGNFNPVKRESYLQRLDGMIYGANPRNGIVKGSMFYHPEMAFQLRFPEGWSVVNQPTVVLGISPGKDAAVQLSLGKGEEPLQALSLFFRQNGIRELSSERTQVDGLPAAGGEFIAQTKQGQVHGRAVFVLYNERLYRIIGYSPQRAWNKYSTEISRSANSFSRLTDDRYLRAEPLRLKIIRTQSSISLKELHARHNVAIPLEELARLNQIDVGEILESGRYLKVVAGDLP